MPFGGRQTGFPGSTIASLSPIFLPERGSLFARKLVPMIPGTTINTIERCSGHGGTFGVKKPTHQNAMKIGKPVFKAMATMKDGSKPDFISSDCPLGGHHIAQGFEVNGLGAPELQHPISLVARAYGLK